MSGTRFGPGIGVAVLLAALGSAFFAPQASALEGAPYVATDPSNIGDTVRTLEATSPYDIPGTPAAPGSAGSGASWADEAYAGLQQLPVTEDLDAPESRIATQSAQLNRAAGLLPKVAKLGKVFMGPLTGFVAWQAGDYLLGKVFSASDPPAGAVFNLNGFRLLEAGESFVGRCWTLPSGPSCDTAYPPATRTYTAPSVAVRVYEHGTSSREFYYCPGHPSYPERQTPEGMVGPLPAGAQVVPLQTEASTGKGACSTSSWVSFVVVDPISPGEFSPAGSPGGLGGPQVGSVASSACSVNWTCPTASNIETITKNGLDSGNYPMLSRFLDHEAKPELFPDPTVTEVENEDQHRCDVSEPAYKNPGGNTTPDPYELRPEGGFVTFGRPSGAQSTPDLYLRWGSTTWGGQYLDDWPGWGWRHIQAKHGWGPSDEAATRAALASPVVQTETDPTTMVYRGVEYQRNGAICQRKVVVQFSAATGPKGIISSYGDYLGEAP